MGSSNKKAWLCVEFLNGETKVNVPTYFIKQFHSKKKYSKSQNILSVENISNVPK